MFVCLRLEELCLLLLGASSLQFSSKEMETYQMVKGSCRQQLSYKVGWREISSCLRA